MDSSSINFTDQCMCPSEGVLSHWHGTLRA